MGKSPSRSPTVCAACARRSRPLFFGSVSALPVLLRRAGCGVVGGECEDLAENPINGGAAQPISMAGAPEGRVRAVRATSAAGGALRALSSWWRPASGFSRSRGELRAAALVPLVGEAVNHEGAAE